MLSKQPQGRMYYRKVLSIEEQLKAIEKDKRGMRWQPMSIRWAMTIKHCSKSAYMKSWGRLVLWRCHQSGHWMITPASPISQWHRLWRLRWQLRGATPYSFLVIKVWRATTFGSAGQSGHGCTASCSCVESFLSRWHPIQATQMPTDWWTFVSADIPGA